MFRNLWTKIKGVMQKMGLIKGLKDLSLHRKIELSDKHYDSIQVWKELYQVITIKYTTTMRNLS